MVVSPYSSSLWNCWLKFALRNYVSTQVCNVKVFGGRESGKILPWLVSQARPTRLHCTQILKVMVDGDRRCETESV